MTQPQDRMRKQKPEFEEVVGTGTYIFYRQPEVLTGDQSLPTPIAAEQIWESINAELLV